MDSVFVNKLKNKTALFAQQDDFKKQHNITQILFFSIQYTKLIYPN